MSSSIPAARNYFLYTLCQNALPQDAYIWFGKRLSVFSAPLTLQCYGWTATQEPAELAPNLRREEIYDLDCALSSYQGDEDFNAREAEVMANWSLITTALGNDATLGANVRWAQVVEYTFTPDSPGNGQSTGSLEFKIGCVQRIESKS